MQLLSKVSTVFGKYPSLRKRFLFCIGDRRGNGGGLLEAEGGLEGEERGIRTSFFQRSRSAIYHLHFFVHTFQFAGNVLLYIIPFLCFVLVSFCFIHPL